MLDMRWFKKLPWSRQSSRDYAEILLGSFLGRKPDPASLEYYTSLIYKRAGFTKILGEITQSQEYKSNFGFRKKTGEVDRPCVWAGEKYHEYANEIEIKSILVVKLDHIGDFILALDSFAALRRAFPSAKLTLLCGPWNASLARSTGIFEHVATLDFFAPTADAERPNFSRQTMGDIAETSFDLAIDLRVDPDTRVVLDHLSAKYKCGYVSGACESVLTIATPRPNFLYSTSLANNQRMIMLSLAHSVVDFFQHNPELSGAALREKLAGTVKFDLSFRDGRPLVAMHPFSGRLIKNWPIENFMRLASWLTGEMGVAVVLLGTKGDADGLPSLAEMAKLANANSLIGETSLQEAIAIISQADLYIGNDSGLTHVAARLDIPSLAIFSGVAPIENWAPFGKDVTIIHAPVECAPCSLPSLDYCPNGHKCIGAIDFEYVQSEVRRRLRPCLDRQ